MSSQVIDGWKPIHGVPGKTIVWQNIDGSYTVTIDPLAIGDGSGDMLKSVYDADGDNIVDLAESVPWSGVADRPTEFNPSAHTHDGDDITSQVGSAAIADSVPWSGVTDKPTAFPPSAHDHDDRYYTESETDSLLAGYVLKSTFDANTILIANSDDTPVALSVGASTIVGRGATGGIAALSAGDARTVLGLATTDAPTFGTITAFTNSNTANIFLGYGSPASTDPLRVKIDGYGRQYWYLRGSTVDGTSGSEVGSLQFATPSAFPGIVVYTGATYDQNRFDMYNAGTRWQMGFRADIDASRHGFIIRNGGSFGFNAEAPTISDGVGVDINGKILRLRTSKTPSSASDTGNVGEICWDASYVYVCTASNTWKRAAISTW